MSLIKQASKSVINHSYWYPHWDEEDIEGHKYECLSGNKKIKRMVDIAVCYCIMIARIKSNDNVVNCNFSIHHFCIKHIQK